MKFLEIANNSTGVFTLTQSRRMAGVSRCISVPVAVLSAAISKGEELVLHYEARGRKLDTAVKLTKHRAVKEKPNS